MHWSEYARLQELRDKWYGRAEVGDGADRVMREELDPWQKFAYDVVFASEPDVLRMMLMGSAGTGKSIAETSGAARSRSDRAWVKEHFGAGWNRDLRNRLADKQRVACCKLIKEQARPAAQVPPLVCNVWR